MTTPLSTSPFSPASMSSSSSTPITRSDSPSPQKDHKTSSVAAHTLKPPFSFKKISVLKKLKISKSTKNSEKSEKTEQVKKQVAEEAKKKEAEEYMKRVYLDECYRKGKEREIPWEPLLKDPKIIEYFKDRPDLMKFYPELAH